MLSQEDEERLVSVPRTCNKRNSRDVIVLTLYFMTAVIFGPTWPKTVAYSIVLETKLITFPSKTRQSFGVVHVADMFSVKKMYNLLISVQASENILENH